MNSRKSDNNKNKLLYDPNQANLRRLGAFSSVQNYDENEIDDVRDEELENNDFEEKNITDNSSPSSSALDDAKELGKGQAKSAVSNAAKQVGKQVAAKGKAVASALGKKLLAFIAANPWVLAILAVVIVIFLIILLIAGGGSNGNGYYSQECNFNASTVVLNTCNSSDTKNISIEDYVIGTTYGLLNNNDYSDDVIKAVMIVVKTNALSYGNYNSAQKILMLDDCIYNYIDDLPGNIKKKYSSLYSLISNYLYVSSSFTSAISNMGSNSSLNLDKDVIAQMNELSMNYKEILNNVYSGNSDIVGEYRDSLFVGDSRLKGMVLSGVVNESNAVYGVGYGYNWFVGDGTFDSSYTNSISGGISGINDKIIKDKNYNIIVWLGINDLLSNNASTYFNKYYELATGSWSNHTIYVVNVGPVNDNASVSNDNINLFNNAMKGLIASSGIDNLKFINVNYNINNFDES